MVKELIMMVASIFGGDNATIDDYLMQKAEKPAVYANMNASMTEAEKIIDELENRYDSAKEAYNDSWKNDLALETNEVSDLAKKYIALSRYVGGIKMLQENDIIKYDGDEEKEELKKLIQDSENLVTEYKNVLTAFWNKIKDDLKISWAIQYKSKDQDKHSEVQRASCGFDYEMRFTSPTKPTVVLSRMLPDFEKKELEYAFEILAKIRTKYSPLVKTKDPDELKKDFENKFYKIEITDKVKEGLRTQIVFDKDLISDKGTEFTKKGIDDITDGKEDRNGEIELLAAQFVIDKKYTIAEMMADLNETKKRNEVLEELAKLDLKKEMSEAEGKDEVPKAKTEPRQ